VPVPRQGSDEEKSPLFKSLRELDSSELGERFLDCVIVEDMPEDRADMEVMK
jgi:hypothetical protein